MANLVQLKMLENLDGFLLVDKPAGIAFSSVVKSVKRKFNLVKVGHGGSLDAMASGLFILLIGDANKFVERVMGADREYEGTLDFTRRTNTGDLHGAELGERGGATPDFAALAKELKGDVFQAEPRFAAIRKEGVAEYEIVDTGEHGQFMAHVYRLVFDAAGGAAEVKFACAVTKQFLPRAMAVEAGATLISLRRTKIGKFDVRDAVPFSKLLETEASDFAGLVTPLKSALQ